MALSGTVMTKRRSVMLHQITEDYLDADTNEAHSPAIVG